MAIKVFQIGFNKCGTRTIHHFLKRHRGLRAVHWDNGELAKTMYRNLANGDPLMTGYENFNVFTDMETITRDYALEGFKLFPVLAREYPDARFILNTRDREDWIKSRLSHRDGTYLDRWKALLGVEDVESLTEIWRADWDRHHARVAKFFADQPHRLATFDIAKDSPEVIAKLLPESNIDVSLYGHAGRTKNDDVADAGEDEVRQRGGRARRGKVLAPGSASPA